MLAQKKSVSNVWRHEATACSKLVSAANRLPTRCFVRVPKRWTSPGARLGQQIELSVTNHKHSWQREVRWFQSLFDLLRSTWLASKLQQTPTWSKLSSPGYRHLTPISSTLGHKLGCQGGTTASVFNDDYVEVWCVPSATDVPCTSKSEYSPAQQSERCLIF
jgi:hypothetical protein